jgi:hypothetical protein
VMNIIDAVENYGIDILPVWDKSHPTRWARIWLLAKKMK